MKINTSDIKNGTTRRYSGTEPCSILELENDDLILLKEPVHYELTAVLAFTTLHVTGKLSIALHLRCSRCAELFPITVEENNFNEEWKVNYEGEIIDITDEIRQAVILRIPPYPLCKPTCKGLCMKCGTNLNLKKCSCSQKIDNRWAELDKLNIDK
jgi:uncharacterized protein